MLQIRLTSPLVTISLFTNQISFQDTAPDIQHTFLVAFMFAWIYFDVFGLIYWYIYLVDIFRWIYLVGYICTSLIWISPEQYRSITLDWCIICFFFRQDIYQLLVFSASPLIIHGAESELVEFPVCMFGLRTTATKSKVNLPLQVSIQG